MRPHALRWPLILLLLPTLLVGCLGGRRTSRSTSSTVSADSAKKNKASDTTRVPSADSVDAARNLAGKKPATDSGAKRAADTTATKADSTTKKGAKKPEPVTKQCVLDFNDSPPETRMRYQRLPDSTGLTFIGGGFVGHCQGEKNQIKADSAEQYQATGILNLIGNVRYEEPGKLRFESQHATYFTKEERIFADGNVVATQLGSGSTFRGTSIEYLRPLAGARTTSRLIAPNRPTLQLLEKDSTGKPGPPVTVTATTMVDEADSVLFAWGDVQINRVALVGESDSASFDKTTEKARLIRSARITNRDKAEPFRMFGDTIDLYSSNRKLERVVARHNGNASNNDVVMQAEILDFRFDDQKIEKAYASGKGRAKATTTSQQLVADSLEIRMPDQHVREVKAIGKAVATGNPDTLKIKSDDRDILRGDTVTAWFDSIAVVGDTSQSARIQQIHAFGNASSLFQIASKEGPKAPASLNYVRGQKIFVAFDSGQVRSVAVDSAASGLYLEPASDSLSDSTKAGKAATKGRSTRPPVQPAPKKKGGGAPADPLLLSEFRRRS